MQRVHAELWRFAGSPVIVRRRSLRSNQSTRKTVWENSFRWTSFRWTLCLGHLGHFVSVLYETELFSNLRSLPGASPNT